MVLVRSSGFRSKKPFVNVEVRGVADAIRFIRVGGKNVFDGADLGVFQGANLIQQEWQESIIGARDEPKSVDTGRYANSPELNKKAAMVYEVSSDVPYGPFLEFGTANIPARNHLENTIERNRRKVRSNIRLAIKLKTSVRRKF